MPGTQVSDFAAHGVRSCALARGNGEMHVWLLTFEPGGEIGTHLAGFDQLFYVLDGSAWLEVSGERVELAVGEGATVELGQNHAKGSHDGARVLMVQINALDLPRE